MNKINLLPWREELRVKLNKIFYFELAKNVGYGIVVIIMVNIYLAHRISLNTVDVSYVNSEMQKISFQATELQGIDTTKKHVLERIGIIQSLQQDRFSIVTLLDTLPRVIPDGLYFTMISRKVKTVPISSATKTSASAAPSAVGGGGKGGGKGRGGAGPAATATPAGPPTPGTASGPTIGGQGGKGAATPTPTAPNPSAGGKGGAAAKPGSKDQGPMKEKYVITLEGVADSNAKVALLLQNLENISYFDSVKLNSVSSNKTGVGLSFQVEFMQDINE